MVQELIRDGLPLRPYFDYIYNIYIYIKCRYASITIYEPKYLYVCIIDSAHTWPLVHWYRISDSDSESDNVYSTKIDTDTISGLRKT